MFSRLEDIACSERGGHARALRLAGIRRTLVAAVEAAPTRCTALTIRACAPRSVEAYTGVWEPVSSVMA